MSEVNFGMKLINLKLQFSKHTKKDSLVKMLVEVDLILMFMFTQELELIFVERKQD